MSPKRILSAARARPRARALGPPWTVAALAGAALALVASGCSVKGADNANLIVGKQQFVAKCGSCHTLARAGTKGIVGPNLDAAFHQSLSEGYGRDTVRGIVEEQIKIPNPEGAMPKDLVHGNTRRDVAAYVSQVVDRAGQDTGLLASAVAPAGAGKPVVESGGKLIIPASATGQLAYVTNKALAKPGPVTVEMPNQSGVDHNIAIQQGTSGAVLGASPIIAKGVATAHVTLKPGTYTFFCQVPGHRQAGMLGTLIAK
jgi:mono/diheme cytochrome c family protein